jgi:hypothetical protein
MIAEGFLRMRGELAALGICGFQWLDGSFVEDIETRQGRDPADIDVVTFVAQPQRRTDIEAALTGRDLLNRAKTKATFHVDHFLVPLCCEPELLVDLARYWYGLFSHCRNGIWKGMLRVELSPGLTDDAAWKVLGTKP